MTRLRSLFDIPDNVCYLNAAYMGPMPRSAVSAAQEAAQQKCHPWDITLIDFFQPTETIRQLVAPLFGVTYKDIAIVPSASYGLATAAQNMTLTAGQEIVILAEQFPSNVYVWRRLAERHKAKVRVVTRTADQSWTQAILAAIGPQTGIVACAQTHWVDGGYVDLEAVSDALAIHGGELVLDLSQSLGVQAIDLARVRPAFAVAVGYKWLIGPYTLAYLYARPDKQSGVPLEEGWINREGSRNFARLVDCRETFGEGAQRYDMGERSNMQLIPQALPGLSLLADLGPKQAADLISQWTDQIVDRAAGLGVIADAPDIRSRHYLGLTLPPSAPDDLLEKLKARQVHVSQRGTRLRVTPHIYTTQADIDRFIAALADSL